MSSISRSHGTCFQSTYCLQQYKCTLHSSSRKLLWATNNERPLQITTINQNLALMYIFTNILMLVIQKTLMTQETLWTRRQKTARSRLGSSLQDCVSKQFQKLYPLLLSICDLNQEDKNGQAKVDKIIPKRPHSHRKSYRQPRNAEVKRNSLFHGRAHQMVSNTKRSAL